MYNNIVADATVKAFFDFAETNKFALVKVHRGAKRPVGDDWPDLYSEDRAGWERWRAEGFNLGVHAGASRLITFDLDSKHGGIAAVRQRFDSWCVLQGMAPLPHHVETPSAGHHVFMQVPEGTDPMALAGNLSGKIGKGVDVLIGNRQSVAPGSYFDGTAEDKPSGVYKFKADAALYEAPSRVLEFCTPKPRKEAGPGTGDFDYTDMEDRCRYLAEQDDYLADESNWVKAIWAIRLAFGDRGWPLAEIVSYRDHKNRLHSVWEREDANVTNPSRCATLIDESDKAGYREHKRAHLFDGVAQLVNAAPTAPAAAPDQAQALGPAMPTADQARAAAAKQYEESIDAAHELEIPTPVGGFIQSSGQFLAGHKPADYLIKPIFQRRYLYSITAQTDTGKTTIAMRFAAHVATGIAIDGNVTCKKGTVLYFCGENPDDVRTRWMGLTRDMGIDPVTTDVHFVSDAMHLSKVADRITREVVNNKLQVALVIVDTSAAYFETDNESDPIQALAHAKRLRSLTLLPGGPCVMVLCHPTKNAKDDELIPRGGSGFVNEVDGNCALRRSGDAVSGEKQGKFRGPSFSPFSFELVTIWDHPQIVDSDGLPMPTVVARPISTAELHRVEEIDSKDDVAVLNVLCAHRGIKQADIAKALDWFYRTGAKQGKPNGSKARDALKRLQKKKYAEEAMSLWTATPKGQKVATLVEGASIPSQQIIALPPANLGDAPYPTPRMTSPPPMPPNLP